MRDTDPMARIELVVAEVGLLAVVRAQTQALAGGVRSDDASDTELGALELVAQTARRRAGARTDAPAAPGSSGV